MAGHNHLPWCTCGWCTGGWGKGRGSSPRKMAYMPLYKWDYDYIPRIHSFKSFINPNARCPVCYERVFFYQSPYGGKVFFDELGPPWTKHPCTTREKAPLQPYDIDIYQTKDPSWKRYKWSPYICKIFSTKDSSCTLICDDEIVTCFFPNNNYEVKEGSLVYLRKVNNEYIEASILFDENKSKNIILSNRQNVLNTLETVLMEEYVKTITKKFKTYNIECNKIDKSYYSILVNDPNTSETILTYIFFRFFDDKHLLKNIAKHPASIKSGMSDIFEYIIKLGMKGFMDNFFKSYKYYENEHIQILKNIKNVPIANGIKRIIYKKEEKLKPAIIKSSFIDKGWLVK